MTGFSERPSRKPPETRTAAHAELRSPTTDWRAALKALQRAERRQLQATHAGGYALLRAGDTAKASALAHAEIALAFAHRWAEIRRGPAALRAAAAAALQAEQAAALSTRLVFLLGQASDEHRTARAQLGKCYAGERTALARRHRGAWAAAAAVGSNKPAKRTPSARPLSHRQSLAIPPSYPASPKLL